MEAHHTRTLVTHPRCCPLPRQRPPEPRPLHPYPTLLPADCASCGSKGAIQLDPWHHLCCNMHKRREINLRHDSVVNALYHHASHSGAAACKQEPPGLSTEDGRRPDLQIILPGACILTDVVVSHPLAPSHLLAASRSALIVARLLEYRSVILQYGVPGLGEVSNCHRETLGLSVRRDEVAMHYTLISSSTLVCTLSSCCSCCDVWGASTAVILLPSDT